MVIQSIGFTATAPGTGAAAAAVAGDSLIVMNGKNPRILNTWVDAQANGTLQIITPDGHDTTRGYRVGVVSSEPTPRMVMGMPMPLNAQETISLTMVGSATAGDVENGILQIAFDDLPGINQNLISWTEAQRRYMKLTTVDFTLDITAGGAWNGQELITADSDLLRANTEYAILGIESRVESCAVAIRGPFSGGMRLAVPGSIEFSDMTREWFALLSRANNNMRTIPVLNSGDKGNILIDGLQDENVADISATLLLAMLK